MDGSSAGTGGPGAPRPTVSAGVAFRVCSRLSMLRASRAPHRPVKELKPAKSQIDPSATVIYDVRSRAQSNEESEPTRCIQLEVVGGPMDGQTRRIAKAIMTVGRSDNNDFALPLDPMVSGTHARIVREGEHFWLEDLGSRNGTYFGDERLRARALIASGTNFVVGRTSLEFTAR